MKLLFAGLIYTLLVFVTTGCAQIGPSQPDHLIFQPEVHQEDTGEFVVSLKIRNSSKRAAAAARPNANAVMELRGEHGILRGRMEIVSLIAIEPESTLDPGVWRGRLEPGDYQVFWGAPGLGHTTAQFTITELAGRPQLGEVHIMSYPDQDMPMLPVYGDAQPLVDMAIQQLAGQLDVDAGLITPVEVEPVDFPDASLGAPQPDQMYAQVITPGYIIELSYQGLPFVFHGSGERVAPAPANDAAGPIEYSITIEAVHVDDEQVTVQGRSTLPDETCLGTELWINGELAPWWPAESCASIQQGYWQMIAPLGIGQTPAVLDPAAQYMLRAWLPGGSNIVAVFAFDLTGRP